MVVELLITTTAMVKFARFRLYRTTRMRTTTPACTAKRMIPSASLVIYPTNPQVSVAGRFGGVGGWDPNGGGHGR